MQNKASGVVTAFDVLKHLLKVNPEIYSLRFVVYEESPNWRDLPEATKERNPRLALKQDLRPRLLKDFERQKILHGSLSSFQRGLYEEQLVGITSIVTVNGNRTAHIPMMDFACPTSPKNLATLEALLKESGQCSGFILQSGRSYHFYGTQLLLETAWRVFMGRCLLMEGFTDYRYVGHQLVEGRCVLRISTSHLKPRLPLVVRQF